MIKLVIFDFDDTIIDNKNLDYQSFRQVSMNLNGYMPTKINISKLRKENYLAIEIVNWLLKKSKNRFNVTHFWEERLKFLESKKSLKYISLRPYSKLFLKKLKKHNIIVIIATLRKNKKILELFIENEGIMPCIDSIFNLKDKTIETRKLSNAIKSKKDLFNQILKSYNFKSEEILSIGDSKADYKAAKSFKINHIILKINNSNQKNSKKHFFNFKELNYQFESIFNTH